MTDTKIYCVVYIGEGIDNFKLYNSYEYALKEYLARCIKETKLLLKDDSDTDSQISNLESEDNFSDDTCILQVFEPHADSKELLLIKEYDIDIFEDFISEKDDVEVFIASLEDSIKHDVPLPSEILDKFTP